MTFSEWLDAFPTANYVRLRTALPWSTRNEEARRKQPHGVPETGLAIQCRYFNEAAM